MDARPVDGRLRVEALVEDRRRDADERGTQPRAAGGADRECQAGAVEREAGRHHALHPRARLERADEQVGLAEHAVQMQVETRQPVPGAETEARRQHAGATLGVDRDEVGRVGLRPADVGESVDEARAFAPAQRGREASGAVRARARRRPARRASGTACRRTAPRPARPRSRRSRSRSPRVRRRRARSRSASSDSAIEPRVDARGALCGHELER